MKKEKSNIFDKIIESYLEYTKEDNYEILNEKYLKCLRKAIGGYNITRLYEYDCLSLSLKNKENAYPLMETLQKLWIDTRNIFKEEYGISKISDILNEVSENVDDILSLGYDEIVAEIQKLGY